MRDIYHWAPLQDDRKPGSFLAACLRPDVGCFYVSPFDFMSMPVRRCEACEGILEVGLVALGVAGCKGVIDFLAGPVTRPHRSLSRDRANFLLLAQPGQNHR